MADAPLLPTGDDEQFLSEITQDFKRLQAQKAKRQGGAEARMLVARAFEAGEQGSYYKARGLYARNTETDEEKNKLHLVFNLVKQRKHKLVGRLGAIGATFKANPDKTDVAATDLASIVDRLILALDKKVDQPALQRALLDLLTLEGVCVEYVGWNERATIEPMPQFTPDNQLLFVDRVASDASGQLVIVPEAEKQAAVAAGKPDEAYELYEVAVPTGEIHDEILSGLQVFVDARVTAIETLAPGQAIYVAWYKTQAWLEEYYGAEAIADLAPDTDGSMLASRLYQGQDLSLANTAFTDLISHFVAPSDPNDPPMNLFVERYQPPSRRYPRGRQTCFIPGKRILRDGDNPYPEIPLVDYHFEPPTKSFWTTDFLTDLLAAQRFINKRMSQLGEQSNATLYANLLLGPGVAPKDIPVDTPGPIANAVSENGAVLVRRQEPPLFPPWFMDSINLTIKFLNDLAGGADLVEEHKFPGQLRGPMAVPMLQEIIDTEWGPLYQHLGERLARAKQLRLNRVKQFYPPSRTLHYTDRTQRDEVFEFHKEELFGAGTNFNITVERGSLLPELRALREARIRERLQGPLAVLYQDPRTGQLDRGKIAADLQFGDDGREGRVVQDRKLARALIARLWKAEPIPPVMPYYDHPSWLDELEAAMKTTEFLEASPPIQDAFNQRWAAHHQFLQQAASAQAQAGQAGAMQNAIAQATQQAAAKAAAETVDQTMEQMRFQAMHAPQMPQMLSDFMHQAAGGPGQPAPGPAGPPPPPPPGLPPGPPRPPM